MATAGAARRSCLLLCLALAGGFGLFSQTAEHLQRAQEALKAGRPADAIAEFTAVLALDPKNLDARANLGVLQYFGGRYSDAVENLRAALSQKSDLVKLRALLGMAEKRTGQNAAAIADLEQSFPRLVEQKLKIEAGLELIELYYGRSDLPKAAEVANALRQAKPDDPDILYAAHRIYSELADETTLALAMVAPDSARMKQLTAHELARQAKDKTAIARYREAIQIDPKRSDLHFELAEMLNSSSSEADKAAAEREYRTALSLDPFDEKSVCRLGDAAVRHADSAAAEKYYTQALQMQPNDAEANLSLAKVLMAQHRSKEALPLLEKSLAIEPFNPPAHYRLSVLYRELGRGEEARREMTQFQKLKKMKTRLGDIYQDMHVTSLKTAQSDSESP
jgi:tetratricopeptide (TPR) repeat protein